MLNFYEVDTHIEELLYEMFMDFRMKTYQAAFHFKPDYTTWYGYAKMKEALVEMKKEAANYKIKIFGGIIFIEKISGTKPKFSILLFFIGSKLWVFEP